MADSKELVSKALEFDYVRFTWTDLNGRSRGKIVPKRHVERFLKTGMHAYGAAVALGPANQISILKEAEEYNHGNASFKPDLNTMYHVNWAGYGEKRVGEVLCEPSWVDGIIQTATPRYVARKQLEELKKIGYSLKTSCELEFQVRVPTSDGSDKPLFPGSDCFCNLTFVQHEKLIYSIDAAMLAAGVNLECLQTEWTPGQFELTIIPQLGITGADHAFIFREGVKEICALRGQQALFVTRPFGPLAGNSCHFNHSLWSEDGKSPAMYDSSDPDKLSSVAKHWIAGLLKHARAITALAAPTVNCYRRFFLLGTPNQIFWGPENRFALYRVRTERPEDTLIEGRIGCSAANPYLILAAHVAAGLDGIKNKLELPAPVADDKYIVPKTLAEALDALEADTVMTEALGSQFISWYTQIKREIDLKELEGSDMSVADEEAIKKEREMYQNI